MSKIIGIIGNRKRNLNEDFQLVLKKFFEIYKEGDIICSGGCDKGGDKFAYLIHKKYFIPYLEFPANWSLGKHAGFVRNKDIAKWSDILIACVSEERVGGTENTIELFMKKENHREMYLV